MRNFQRIITILFLVLCFVLNTQAQRGENDIDVTKINQVDKQGKKHGIWMKRYENGRIRYEGLFNHGEPGGTFYFYENKIHNNNPSIKKVFYQDVDYEEITYYYDNGKVNSKGNMLGKVKNGLWKYYDGLGRVILTENYKLGILEGKQKVFFNTGVLTEERNYVNGKLHGLVTRYSQHTDTLHKITYYEGMMHGRATFYQPNGVIRESGLHYKNSKVGGWDFYIRGKYMGFKDAKDEKPIEEEELLASVNLDEIVNPVYTKEQDDILLEELGIIAEREEAERKAEVARLKKKKEEEATKKAEEVARKRNVLVSEKLAKKREAKKAVAKAREREKEVLKKKKDARLARIREAAEKREQAKIQEQEELRKLKQKTLDERRTKEQKLLDVEQQKEEELRRLRGQNVEKKKTTEE